MHKIIFSSDAKEDISEIQKFIGSDNILSAIKVLNSIKKTIDYLENFPEIGVPLNNHLRQIIEQKYKYRIIYRIIDEKEILIFAIFKYKNIF